MRSSLLLVVGALLPALYPAPAEAQEPAASRSDGWYVGVFGGWSHRKDIAVEESRPLFDFTASVDVEDGFLAGVTLGIKPSPWLRAEAELSGHWHEIGGDADLTATGLPIPVSVTLFGDINAYFALANLWVDIPIDSEIKPYIGGGIGAGRISGAIDTAQDLPILNDRGTSFAYQLGAGLSLRVAPNATAQIGYRYKAIEPMELEITTLFGNTEIESHYRSHSLLLGLQFEL
jgi:opacity protein-like surface antigen